MPAPLPTPSGVVQCRLHHEPSNDNFVYPRFNMAYTSGPPDVSDLVAVATAVSGAWASHLKSYLASADALYDVTCRDLANPDHPVGVYAATVAGTRSGNQPALNFTLLLNKTVDRTYRGSKPKNFLPYGTVTDLNDDRSWQTGLTGAFPASWENFIAELAGSAIGSIVLGGEVCVSYYGPPTVAATKGRSRMVSTVRDPPLVKPITGYSCSQIAGSQRRRLRSRSV